MIEAIIFDWGGVLSANPSIREFVRMYAPKLGVNVEEMTQVVLDNWMKARVDEIDSELYWKNIANFLKIDYHVFRHDMLEFSGFQPSVSDMARALKKNYKIALLSNHIRDWLEEEIDNRNMREVFDVIITSYNSGLAKPDPKIYQLTANKLNLKPEECVFVDDMRSNLLPAKDLGMHTIHYENPVQLKKELMDLGVQF
jgi:epoxide hydrolase-like predicted phosphatase